MWALPSGSPQPTTGCGAEPFWLDGARQHAQGEARASEKVLKGLREAMRTRWHLGGPLEKGKDSYALGFHGLPDLATGTPSA